MKKQIWKTGALCLAGVVALSVTGVSVYAKTSEKKETEIKEQIQDAVDDIWKSEDTSAASIDETVYVILNADGTQQKIYVSDWLKNQGEKDSYTQSTPDKEAPVSLKVTYSLDGNEISAADLNGKSGHVVIRYDYANELYETREIAGKEEKIYVPFAVMTGMILDNDNFSNIWVSSGKVINDGSHSVVTGIVFPGLGTNLDMEEDLDDYLEIEADVTDFTMNESYCIATNSVFSKLDLSNMDDLDDLKSAMDDLEDATNQLLDGTSDLYDGVNELYDKSGDLMDGVEELNDGSNDLRDGAYQVANGTVSLREGIGALQSGAGTLRDGTKTLQAGAVELNQGLTKLAANNDTLNAGAAQVFDQLLAAANAQLKDNIQKGQIQALTKENYHSELKQFSDTLAALSTKDGATMAVLAQFNMTLQDYKDLVDAASASGSNTASQAAVVTEETAPVAVSPVTTPHNSTTVSDGDAEADSTLVETADADNASVENTDTAANNDPVVAQTAPAADNTPVVYANDSAAAQLQQINAAIAATQQSAQTAKPQIDSLLTSLDSYNTFYQGLLAYTAGVASANAGAAKVSAGTTQILDGANKLVSGSDDLFKGANTLVDGAKDLATGSGTLANGVNTLSDGSNKLIDGVGQLKDGAKKLKDGMIEYSDEAISKLTDMDTDELQEVIDRMKATASVSENYDSFTGSGNGMNSSVKFIYKINAVK